MVSVVIIFMNIRDDSWFHFNTYQLLYETVMSTEFKAFIIIYKVINYRNGCLNRVVKISKVDVYYLFKFFKITRLVLYFMLRGKYTK